MVLSENCELMSFTLTTTTIQRHIRQLSAHLICIVIPTNVEIYNAYYENDEAFSF